MHDETPRMARAPEKKIVIVPEEKPFRFKQFIILQDRTSMKIGTDGTLLGAWAPVENATQALDIGTGTGIIALMMAQRNPDLNIDAVEIDADAADQAIGNVLTSPFSDQIEVYESSIQEFMSQAGYADSYDLIVSNPPFFTGGTLSESQSRAAVRHTVKLPHHDLLQAVRQLLTLDGLFCCVLPHLEGLRFIELANRAGLYVQKQMLVHSYKDKPVERMLLCFGRRAVETVSTSFVIYDSVPTKDNRGYSAEYQELTKEFHIFIP
jgi:tRNA1Val (adenine37-N6)-methyltransferase